MREIAAFVFAAEDTRGEAAFGDGEPEIGGASVGRRNFDRDGELGGLRQDVRRGDSNRSVGRLCQIADALVDFTFGATDKISAAIDYQLRGVDTVVVKCTGVLLLPFGPIVG